MIDAIAGSAFALSVAGMVTLLALARPARCPSCGDLAVSAEERTLANVPPVVAYVERCPRCWGVVARRTVGAGLD